MNIDKHRDSASVIYNNAHGGKAKQLPNWQQIWQSAAQRYSDA
ncbi:hypothetical protein ACLKA6_007495 [Drosophila palustris]